jgi:predicted DNA-binding protein (UPF0251 family)
MTLPPLMRGFKPFGIPRRDMDVVNLFLEEYEAIRMADYLNYTHEEASKKMNISRPTFTRIYEKARKKVATAFVEAKALIIDGGSAHFNEKWCRCKDCDNNFINKQEAELFCPFCESTNIEAFSTQPFEVVESQLKDTGLCGCSDCNIQVPHKSGIPCRSVKCPECGKYMKRMT